MSDDRDRTEDELEKTRRVVREQVLAQSAANQKAATPEADDGADEVEGWDAYTKEELVEEARSRNLPVSGSKGDLVARLAEYDANGGQ